MFRKGLICCSKHLGMEKGLDPIKVQQRVNWTIKHILVLCVRHISKNNNNHNMDYICIYKMNGIEIFHSLDST